MTNREFSNEFDILYNNIMSNKAPGLDEYEKSVFLTNAQESIILELYSGKNSLGDSFEKTEEIRRYLDSLVQTYTTKDKQEDLVGISNKSSFYKLPSDLWFITYEAVTFEENTDYIAVVPMTQDDYHRASKNPFRKPNSRRVIRLDCGNNNVELVSEYNIDKYLVRYITKPDPIILEDLPSDISINGISSETECKLNPVLHRAILIRAIQIAQASMGIAKLSE
jgi:hypothetical protein